MVKLYYQCNEKNQPVFDFCWSAKMGAEECSIPTFSFEQAWEVPNSPYNIIVGSVEVCEEWLKAVGFQVPKAIDIELFKEFLGREYSIIAFEDLKNQKFPLFLKPHSKIKAFTGFVAQNYDKALMYSEGYEGDLCIQSPINILSEYRLYVTNNKIIGIKHYFGNPLIFPKAFPHDTFISECVNFAIKNLNLHSFSLNFGVLENGDTILIEPNDGWALGNYGLQPKDYYLFVRNRWLQMTGIRKKIDYML